MGRVECLSGHDCTYCSGIRSPVRGEGSWGREGAADHQGKTSKANVRLGFAATNSLLSGQLRKDV